MACNITNQEELRNQGSSSEEDSTVVEDEIHAIGSNPGWADAIARVLRSKKPKKCRSIVLSRAKKLNKVANKVENDNGLQIGDIKQDAPDLVEQFTRRKKREIQAKCRVKPSILDRDREKRLNRIATKGVVQLFNAVRQQQKNLESQLMDAGGSERKRDKVMKSLDKRAFLDVLMGTSRSEPVDTSVKLESEPKKDDESPIWQVLRDDFMMGTARLKDWDKT